MTSNNAVKRCHEVDIIRMAALVGICVVNVPFMALPTESVFASPADSLDKSVSFFVACFLQLKFFILFSFIFGWGMAIQARSADKKGQVFKKRYFRRMAGLAFLGVVHALLVFTGDILLLYAILGCSLWLIKDYPAKKLMKVALWMLPLGMVCLTALAVAIGMAMDQLSTVSTNAGLGGNFWEATQARINDWPGTFIFLLFLQGPLAFSAFCTGLAAAKAGFFAENSAGFQLLRRRQPVLWLIAL